MSRWIGKPLWPPDGTGIKHPVSFGAWVYNSSVGLFGWFGQWTARNDFQTPNLGDRQAVVFPTDNAWNTITIFKSGSFVDPVVCFFYDPVAEAYPIRGVSHQCFFIGKQPVFGPGEHATGYAV